MKPKDDRELLSLRAYAAHRRALGISGVSLFSVQKALRDGRIARTCDEHARCPRGCVRGGIDPIQADADWSQNTTPGALRGDGKGGPAPATMGNPELLAAKVSRETWAARHERLRFEERAGNVVRIDVVQAALYRKARQVRDALQQLRPRLAPRLAVEQDARTIGQILDDAIRETLEAISWDLRE